MVSVCGDAWYYLGVVHICGVVCEDVNGILVEGEFCYNLGQTIVSHEVYEPPGEFWQTTSTFHAAPFQVVSWKVEFPTYPDVAVCFVTNL